MDNINSFFGWGKINSGFIAFKCFLISNPANILKTVGKQSASKSKMFYMVIDI